jgi:ABC-type sugar transport system substrate-binding protein
MSERWQHGRVMLAFGGLALLLAPGCGGASKPEFEPPPFTPAVADAADPSPIAPAGLSTTLLILPPEPDSLFPVYNLEARRQAGIHHILLDVKQTAGDDPIEAVARAIDDAAQRRISVILLVTPRNGSTPVLDAAVARAQAQGTRVIAVARPGPAGVTASVAHRPLADQASDLVKAVLELARSRPRTPFQGKRALLVRNPELEGPWTEQRLQALRTAAEAHGLTVVGELAIAPALDSMDKGRPIQQRLDASDPPDVLLAADSVALHTAALVRQTSGRSESLAVGGFADDENGLDKLNNGSAEAILRTNVEGPIRAAVRMAADLTAGQAPPTAPVVVPEQLLRSTHDPAKPNPVMRNI